jgi:hypothetical protein
MKNILDMPKAILFARVDKKEHQLYLDNRMMMLLRCANENGYYVMYASSSVTKVKDVEEKFLPFIANELIPTLAEEIRLLPPYPITIIVCFWNELVSNKRRPKFKEKLEKLNCKVIEIGNK